MSITLKNLISSMGNDYIVRFPKELELKTRIVLEKVIESEFYKKIEDSKVL